jgi:flagellar motor switch protein FliN/FliY
MTIEEALLRLAESTADAVAKVLRTFAGESVDRGAAVVVGAGQHPFAGLPVPSVIANVDYVDGITGGNVFVMSRAGAHRLAAAMMGIELEPGQDRLDVGELELSAVGEAANQMMAAAATATSAVLGQEVEISPPQTRVVFTADEAEKGHEKTPHATIVSFSVLDEPCKLIQLVPNAFVVRMTRAFADLEADMVGDGLDLEGKQVLFSPELLRRVPVRVSVELGRARMPLARAVGLPAGAVVELDRAADDPVDLFVNGKRYAEGRLVLLEGNEWALRLDRVLGAG